MSNLAFRRLGPNLIVVQNTQPPLDSDWERYLAECKAMDVELGGDFGKCSAIIFTDGGSPTSPQRLKLRELLKGRDAISVIITDNLMARGAISIVSLFNKALVVFPSKDWKAAFTHARIPESRQMEFLHHAVALSREVGDCKTLRAIGL